MREDLRTRKIKGEDIRGRKDRIKGKRVWMEEEKRRYSIHI